MSPLAKEVINKLSKEHDKQVLAEVLNFYEYLKQKKQKEWSSIKEDKPDEEEIEILKEYKNSQEDLVPFTDLIKELNLDGEIAIVLKVKQLKH